MPEVALGEEHTSAGRLLPDRDTLLSYLPKGSIAGEVGAANGDFSRKILDITNPASLHLVDAWANQRYRKGRGVVEKRFPDEIARNQLVLHQGMSTDILPGFEAGFFDWIYIDSDHSYKTTAQELHICDRIVRDDGRIAGHDFCTGNVIKPVFYGVIQAVNEFCVHCNWQYEYVTLESRGHFSFCLRRM